MGANQENSSFSDVILYANKAVAQNPNTTKFPWDGLWSFFQIFKYTKKYNSKRLNNH